MKKSKKEDDKFFMTLGFIMAGLALIIHYFLISDINLHPTLHVVIGIFTFFLLSGILGPLLEKFWKKS